MRSTSELQTSDFVELPCHFRQRFPRVPSGTQGSKRPQTSIDPPEGGVMPPQVLPAEYNSLRGSLGELEMQMGKQLATLFTLVAKGSDP